MTGKERSQVDAIDARTGFEIVWQSGNESVGAYSLLRVPNTAPSKLVYKKPAIGINIELAPTESLFRWRVVGTLDPDTIENLGMKVTEPRDGDTPPFITNSDIEELRRYGEVASSPDLQTNFRINLVVPTNNIYHFLNRVWRPAALSKRLSIHVPDYNLGASNSGNRILPQKEILGRNKADVATLIVSRIH